MTPYKVTATVRQDGTLDVGRLPFPPGERVEVTVSPLTDDPTEGGKYPLRGKTPYRYDDPFGSAWSPGEWGDEE